MARRPVSTLFLVTRRQVVRVDRLAGRRPPRWARFAVEGDRDLAAAIEPALDRAAGLGRTVLVLSTRVVPQVVGFPQASVQGMSPSELVEAIRFEVETLSGIEIEDLLVAVRPAVAAEGQSRFWLNAVRSSEFEPLRRRLMAAGARQIALGHPAGTFSPPAGDDGAGWSEIWEHQQFDFDGASGRLIQVSRLASGGTTEGVPHAARIGGDVPAEWLELTREEFNDPERVAGAAEAVFEDVRQGQPAAPWIRPVRLRSANWLRPVAAAALAVAALAGCAVHWTWMTGQTTELQTQIAAMVQPAADKRLWDAEQLKLLEEQNALEVDAAAASNDLQRVQFFFESQADRLYRLLTVLIELRSQELVIQELLPDPKGMVVAGISLNGESAPLLANRLRPTAVLMGWKVAEVTQEGEKKMISGGPWAFRILLQDIGPFEGVSPEPAATSVARVPPEG